MGVITLSLIGLGVGVSLMTCSWIFAVRRNFFSLVDVSWSYGIGIIGVLYGLLGPGSFERRVLISVLIAAWGLRLGTHLALRLWDKFPVEDRRYTKIKSSWGNSSNRKFFWFFQFQALSQPLLGLPLAFAVQKQSPLSLVDLIGLLVLVIGIGGESLADSQLKRFRAKGTGGVCDVGLWKYSRHPNYFFEWVIWCGFSIFGFSTSWGALSLLAPVVMYLLLNFVTGVPPTEEQSLASKGDLYRNYQKRTNRFFPGSTK